MKAISAIGIAIGRRALAVATLGLMLALSGAPAAAQTIDGDLGAAQQGSWTDPYPDPEAKQAQPVPAASGNPQSLVPGAAADVPSDPITENGTPMADPPVASADQSAAPGQAVGSPAATAAQGDTYKKDDLIGAAEGVFGKGAEGLARMIESWLDKQGEPNGYIVGREGGGAVVVGVRYGSGTLYHKVEGQRPIYWTGPSVGFDLGANAGSTFVLVYNLYDSEQIYKRFPAAEGQAYIVGGFHASYLRRGNTVLIPIRMGAGLRLGINAGYMKFRKTQKWIPF
jgi:hypothetical protein